MIGHHRRPHYVTPETRAAATVLTDAFAMRVEEIESRRLWAERQELLVQRLEGPLIAAMQDHRCAVPHEALSDGAAEAGGRAGDQEQRHQTISIVTLMLSRVALEYGFQEAVDFREAQ